MHIDTFYSNSTLQSFYLTTSLNTGIFFHPFWEFWFLKAKGTIDLEHLKIIFSPCYTATISAVILQPIWLSKICLNFCICSIFPVKNGSVTFTLSENIIIIHYALSSLVLILQASVYLILKFYVGVFFITSVIYNIFSSRFFRKSSCKQYSVNTHMLITIVPFILKN